MRCQDPATISIPVSRTRYPPRMRDTRGGMAFSEIPLPGRTGNKGGTRDTLQLRTLNPK